MQTARHIVIHIVGIYDVGYEVHVTRRTAGNLLGHDDLVRNLTPWPWESPAVVIRLPHFGTTYRRREPNRSVVPNVVHKGSYSSCLLTDANAEVRVQVAQIHDDNRTTTKDTPSREAGRH